jgi:hypothetical protein
MGWADWMIVKLSLEDELHLEREAREVLTHHDGKMVAELCAQLIKQNKHQQILLKQAVGRITELETEAFTESLEAVKKPPYRPAWLGLFLNGK